MNKKEKSVLEEIKTDIKKILEILENPKRLLEGEKYNKKPYNPNDPVTDGQIWRLNQLGVNIPKGLTKAEAHRIISEKLNQSNKKEEKK